MKRHENSLRKESLVRKLVDKNTMEFRKEVKHYYECEQYSASHMHRWYIGADYIAQMRRDHYSDIFNSVNQTIDVGRCVY